MRQSEAIRFVIEIQVDDVKSFKELAAQAVAISRDEPGTVVYDWYLNEATGECRLYEAYETLEALSAHVSGRVFTEVGPKLVQVCKFVRVDAFGPVPPGAKERRGIAPTTWWDAPFAAVSGG